jgi:hypothetical protein
MGQRILSRSAMKNQPLLFSTQKKHQPGWSIPIRIDYSDYKEQYGMKRSVEPQVSFKFLMLALFFASVKAFV